MSVPEPVAEPRRRLSWLRILLVVVVVDELVTVVVLLPIVVLLDVLLDVDVGVAGRAAATLATKVSSVPANAAQSTAS